MKKATSAQSILVALLTMGALSSVASADVGGSESSLSSDRLVAVGPTSTNDLDSVEQFAPNTPPRIVTSDLDPIISAAPIRFGASSSELSPVSRRHLRQLVVPVLLGSSTHKILVEGHSDLNGSHAINDRIARQRAEEVSQYLIQIGVPEDMIAISSAGSRRPLVADRTGIASQVNRRVELHLSL